MLLPAAALLCAAVAHHECNTFAFLSCRHRSLALVCRQWSQLVHSPALLASLDVTIDARTERLMPRLRSLVEWLARRAAGHVRQLHLEC